MKRYSQIKKQVIAMTVASSMLLSASAMAAPKAVDPADVTIIDQSIVDESSQQGKAEQIATLKVTLKDVDNMIASFEKFKKTAMEQQSTPMINFLRMSIAAIGMSSSVIHYKNADADAAMSLLTASISSILSTMLEDYVSKGQIDISDLSQVLVANQAQLLAGLDHGVKTGDLSAEDRQLVADAVQEIGNINNNLSSTVEDIQGKIQATQQEALLVAIVFVGFKTLSKFMPASIRQNITTKLPVATEKAGKAALAGRKAGSLMFGGVNMAPMLSTVLGFASPSTISQIDKILVNLRTTRANLLTQISAQ